VGAAIVGMLVGFLPAIVLSTLSAWLYGASFMLIGFALQLLSGLVGAIAFLRWQTKSVTKTITDYPEPGQSRSHTAEWKGENFDRLLSRHVSFARAANAIDETRKDFDRVGWGGSEEGAPHIPGHERLIQLWFAGNHSDIGGSYPEPESRLSDIALAWMCEEAITVPDGLQMGPVRVNATKLANTGDMSPTLNAFPAANGVQHCEIAGMRDTMDIYAAKLPKWSWLQRRLGAMNWAIHVRTITHDAPVHPTVVARFELPLVTQCASVGTYRPEALRSHDQFKVFYL
jgi:T6SS, Phospholipase effector Tle1-like, catalytic domain